MTTGHVQTASLDRAPRSEGEATILLVDDDAVILETVGSLLSILGYLPVLASTGEEALAKLEAGLEPALLILDMDMPGLGGARTLPMIRILRPELPVVIATGRVTPTVTDLIKRFPFVSLMPKPFGLQDLRLNLV